MNQKERIIELVRQGIITTEEALTLLETKSNSQSTNPTSQTINNAEVTEEKITTFEEAIDQKEDIYSEDEETEIESDFAKQIKGLADDALEFGKGTFDSITNYLRELNDADKQGDAHNSSYYDEDFDFSAEYRQDQADLEKDLNHHQSKIQDNQEQADVKEEDVAQLAEKINQLSVEIDTLEEAINKKQEALTVARQRHREIEIFAELDETTEEMLTQKEHLNMRIEELEKEITELEYKLEETKSQLNSFESQQSAYKHQDFKRMVDQAADKANKFGSEAIKEGQKFGETFKVRMKDFVDNFNTKEFNMSFNVPWVKTESIQHQFVYDAADITVIDFVLNNGSIELKAHEADTVLVDSEIRFHGKFDAYTVETFEQLSTIAVDNSQLIFRVSSPRISMDATLYLPKRIYDYIKLDLLNGDTTIEGIESNDLLLVNKNGDMRLNRVKAVLAELDSLNGDMTIKDSEIRDISVKNINGDFRIVGKVGNIVSNTVNGDYFITKNDTNDSTIKLKSVNGDSKISLPESMNLEVETNISFGEIKNRLSNIEVMSESKDRKNGRYSRMTHSDAGMAKIEVQLTTGDIYLKDSDLN
ncbi:DUF4097 family beta strand repeat-containing protein [Fundicoccus sp. Sow4_H7]|uniref:DUF4097 family beta strand repeat-containing protein n=1 Tax=Fundicoccus sp. Sow4_H7 TaxID=3438784 RepID=UPI003F902238